MRAPRYENSPADQAADRKNAKKAGVSLKAWERSDADKRADSVGQRRLDAAWFAHQKPAT